MANLMGITNPATNYDLTGNSRAQIVPPKPADTAIRNLSDPTRVNRADGRRETSSTDSALRPGPLRYDSNFQLFLRELRQAPDVTAELNRLVTWVRSLASTPELDEGISGELAEFLQLLRVDADGLKRQFLNQIQSENRFSGPLFDLLRRACRTSPEQREAVAVFLKAYSDYAATEHLSRSMTGLLRRLPEYLPRSWQDRLIQLTARLENALEAGDRQEATALLRGELLPYLASYVERTHDLGTARTLIGLLMLQTVRYENGSEKALLQALRKAQPEGLSQLEDEAMLKLLRESSGASRQDAFADRLASLGAKALGGACGREVQEAFSGILQAMLLNESVFLPLRHGLLPAEWEGRPACAEFWVDPDAKEDADRERPGGDLRFFVKMDVQRLGTVEMTLSARANRVELEIAGPEEIAAGSRQIAEDLAEILRDHGFDGKRVLVHRSERPTAITEVFPGLFDGRRSVNVII